MEKIDAFAHVLPNNFYKKMLVIDASIPNKLPFIKHPLLQEAGLIKKYWDGETRQIISCVNINPEDYASPIQAFSLCKAGNEELVQLVAEYKDIFLYAVAMIPYFAERINHILGRELAEDFKKFYVDTALLGNPKTIELAIYYFGIEHVLFLKLGQVNEEKIFRSNVINFINDRRYTYVDDN